MAYTALSVSVSRYTYVPNEQFATIEAAFAAKPTAEWILVPPHASFSLVIDQMSDHVIMKCLDGQDVRVSIQLSYIPSNYLRQNTWDLSAIKRESANDPGRHVVIVKFPHIVFRWYNRQDQVVVIPKDPAKWIDSPPNPIQITPSSRVQCTYKLLHSTFRRCQRFIPLNRNK
jgi:hypothetical protein